LKTWTHCYPTAWRRAKVYRTRQTFTVFNSCIFTPLISTIITVIDNDDRVGSNSTANPSLETSASTVAVSGTNSAAEMTAKKRLIWLWCGRYSDSEDARQFFLTLCQDNPDMIPFCLLISNSLTTFMILFCDKSHKVLDWITEWLDSILINNFK
jgi:hypothetical protein